MYCIVFYCIVLYERNSRKSLCFETRSTINEPCHEIFSLPKYFGDMTAIALRLAFSARYTLQPPSCSTPACPKQSHDAVRAKFPTRLPNSITINSINFILLGPVHTYTFTFVNAYFFYLKRIESFPSTRIPRSFTNRFHPSTRKR